MGLARTTEYRMQHWEKGRREEQMGVRGMVGYKEE